jgi:hypothetical protein
VGLGLGHPHPRERRLDHRRVQERAAYGVGQRQDAPGVFPGVERFSLGAELDGHAGGRRRCDCLLGRRVLTRRARRGVGQGEGGECD